MNAPNDVIGWADVGPEFGSAMPHGSCNARLLGGGICGYPRRSNGVCLAGHPRPPVVLGEVIHATDQEPTP